MLPRVLHARHVTGSSRNRGNRFHSYKHPHHMLSIYLRGRGRYIAGREESQFPVPSLNVLAAGERDRNGLRGPFEAYWCAFEWPAIQSDSGRHLALTLPEGRLFLSHFRPLNRPEATQGVEAMQDLLTALCDPTLAGRLRASGALTQLLALWASRAPATRPEGPATALYRELIVQHAFDSAVSLGELARRIGFTLDHLGTAFQQAYGLTPVRYRTSLRLQRARELLASSAYPIGRIGALAGFSDPGYFARVFQAEVGCSPRRFARTAVQAQPGKAGKA